MIWLNQTNYKDYLPIDFYAFSFAFGGAMGCPGEVNIIAKDGEMLTFNYAYGDMTGGELYEILPCLHEIHFPIFGPDAQVPEGLRFFQLGMGNNLIVSDELAGELDARYQELMQNGYKGILYTCWLSLLNDILMERKLIDQPIKSEE